MCVCVCTDIKLKNLNAIRNVVLVVKWHKVSRSLSAKMYKTHTKNTNELKQHKNITKGKT